MSHIWVIDDERPCSNLIRTQIWFNDVHTDVDVTITCKKIIHHRGRHASPVSIALPNKVKGSIIFEWE